MLPEAAYTTRPAATSPIAGFPPPGPMTPAECLPERPQVYGSPSDYPSQPLHGLNQARFNRGEAAGAPMLCNPCELYGCSSAGQNFSASPYAPDPEVSEAFYETSRGGWTGSSQSRFPWGDEFSRVRGQQDWDEGFCGIGIAEGCGPPAQNVNDMRYSCQGFMGAEGDAPYMLARLLACLRAIYMTLQTAHWQCKGPGYYGKHLMLQKIYEAVEQTYDGLAERLVGYYGEAVVDPVQQSAWISECVGRWNAIACPVERAYVAAQEFAHRLVKIHQALQQTGQLTLGMDNYLGEMAAGHDQHLYLLQRATAEVGHIGHSYTCAPRPAVAGQLRDMRELWASPSVPRPVAVPVRPRQDQMFTNVLRTPSGRSRVYWHGPQQWLVPDSADAQAQQGYAGQPKPRRMRRRWRGPFFPTHTSRETWTRTPEGYPYLPDGSFVG